MRNLFGSTSVYNSPAPWPDPPYALDGQVRVEDAAGARFGRAATYAILDEQPNAAIVHIEGWWRYSSDESHHISRTWLVGNDDGHPYVRRVPSTIDTVQAAYDWLTPVAVKRAIAAGLSVKRQGDMWLVPTALPPKAGICPERRLWGTEHRAMVFAWMSPNGETHSAEYADMAVTHPQHGTLNLDTWHRVYLNRQLPGAPSAD